MGKLFVLMGKSATGKDSLYQMLVKNHPELTEIVTYTTRPIRQGESEGKEYHFVSEDEMNHLGQQGKVIECRRYDTVQGPWYYFTADDGQVDFHKQVDYVVISTLEGYLQLRDYYGTEQVEPIYIEVDDFERLERALKRERQQKNPCVAELCRRFVADEEDFSKERLCEAGIQDGIVNDDLEQTLRKIEQQICHVQ